jgi:hypothetical protein
MSNMQDQSQIGSPKKIMSPEAKPFFGRLRGPVAITPPPSYGTQNSDYQGTSKQSFTPRISRIVPLPPIEEDARIPPFMTVPEEHIYKMRVPELGFLIGHQNRNNKKWNYYSIAGYLADELCQESKEGNVLMEQKIIDKIQEICRDPVWQREIKYSLVYYYGLRPTPREHREGFQKVFTIEDSSLTRSYTVEVTLFPTFINKQFSPSWRKAGIKIIYKEDGISIYRFQVSKYCLELDPSITLYPEVEKSRFDGCESGEIDLGTGNTKDEEDDFEN